jgi:hypothetical protein
MLQFDAWLQAEWVVAEASVELDAFLGLLWSC